MDWSIPAITSHRRLSAKLPYDKREKEEEGDIINNNNNKFIYSPISPRVQWTVQKLKHNISTYVRNITIKENHKNITINEHSEEDKVSQETRTCKGSQLSNTKIN